jgi:hypothetical protein
MFDYKDIMLTVYETKFVSYRWTNYFGMAEDNEFAAMDVYQNRIYLLYNALTGTFGASSTDLIMTVVDYRTGLEIGTKVFGSSSQDRAIDLVTTQIGVFVIADIGDGFKDNDSADSFSTQNGNSNFAILMMDYETNIIEIESYDSSDPTNNLGAAYPKKLVVGRHNKNGPLFAFISTRDNGDNNQGGGVYITQPASQAALLTTGSSVGA